MSVKRTLPARTIATALSNLYRIDALAYTIENITDELHVFSGCEPAVEGLTEKEANAIYHISGLLRELAVLTQGLLLEMSES